MICPACHHPMIMVEYKQIELDFCPHCHGSWFDRDELALMLEATTGHEESSLIRNLLALPAVRAAERNRKCPICGIKMKKLRVGQQVAVMLDACEKEDGLWFDGGEVDQLVNVMDSQDPVKSDHDHVFNFMKEVFKNPVG